MAVEERNRMSLAAKLAKKLKKMYPKRARKHVLAYVAGGDPGFLYYKYLPVEFARDILGVELTPDQQIIARAIANQSGNRRVKVNSGHNVGKTFLAAVLVLWWVYTRDPGVVTTTAPTERDVVYLLWTEVRLLHQRSKVALPRYFRGPRDPQMFHHDEHWAMGFTARKGEMFQGRHRPSMLFVFDECELVEPPYWETTGTMFQPDSDHAWFAIGNPTTTSSQSYLEDLAPAPDGNPKWLLFSLSGLNHPNIIAQLEGKPPPIPNAVTLGQVQQWLSDWTTRIDPSDKKIGDVEWPPPRPCSACVKEESSAGDGQSDPGQSVGSGSQPGDHVLGGPGWNNQSAAVPEQAGAGPADERGSDSGDLREHAADRGEHGSGVEEVCPVCRGSQVIGGGVWYRPGPSFKSRVQGIRPTEGVDTVWSSAALDLAITPRWQPVDCWERNYGITIGVDPAAYGDDDTAIHVRCGPLSLHHEAHNGWEPGQTAGRLKELCREWAGWYNALAFTERPAIMPTDVLVNIEFDGGYGIGVHSHRGEFFNWRGVTAGSASRLFDPNGRLMYANFRSEMWFTSAGLAASGHMDLSRIPPDIRARLRVQLLAPYYEVRGDGARVVEPKKDTKERLKRSPDDADALIVSHASVPDMRPSVLTRQEKPEY